MKVTLRSYTFASVCLTAGLIAKEWREHEQFYPTLEHVGKSKLCSLVIGNLLFSLMLSLGHIIVWIFLGSLRDREVEVLSDRLWPAVTDTLLAMTIFRNEFTPKFLFLFAILLGIKIFHWLAKDRVAFLATVPSPTLSNKVRIFAFLTGLIALDSILAYKIGENFWVKGPSVGLLFLFEYILLTLDASSTLLKYFFNMYDSWTGGLWEDKSVYVLYLEFFVDVLSLMCYVVFFCSIWFYYGLPIHLIRQIYYTLRHFFERFAGVLRYQKAARELERLPDATFEELEGSDNMCAICRDPMVAGKKLPCNHVFHYHCLRSWFLRRQVCPFCRAPIFAAENNAANAAEPNQRLPLPPPPFGFGFPGQNQAFMPPPNMQQQLNAHQNHVHQHDHPHDHQHDHQHGHQHGHHQQENEPAQQAAGQEQQREFVPATMMTAPQPSRAPLAGVNAATLEQTIVQVIEIQEQIQQLNEQVGSLMETLTTAAIQDTTRAPAADTSQVEPPRTEQTPTSVVVPTVTKVSQRVESTPEVVAPMPAETTEISPSDEKKEVDEEDEPTQEEQEAAEAEAARLEELRQARILRYSQDAVGEN